MPTLSTIASLMLCLLGALQEGPPEMSRALSQVSVARGADRIAAMREFLDRFQDLDATVPWLLGQLGEKDKAAAARVLAHLARIHPEAREAVPEDIVRSLIVLIGDSDPEVRIAGSFGLVEFAKKTPADQNRSSLAILGALGKEPDRWACRAYIQALGQIRGASAEVLPVLFGSLDEEDAWPDVRIESLGAYGRSTVDYLVKDLGRREPVPLDVQVLRFSAADEPEFLLERLGELKGFARAAFLVALERIGDRAVPGLIKTLENPDPQLRADAATVLGKLRFRASTAVETLRKLLADEHPFPRRAAALALGGISDPSAIVSLKPLLAHDDPITRKHAAESLGRLRAEGALRELAELLDDPEPAVRQSAVQALGNLGKASLLWSKDLAQMVSQDPDPSIQFACAESLRQIGDRIEEALPAILQGLESHPDAKVRATLAASLEIGSKLPRSALERIAAVIKNDRDAVVRDRLAKAHRRSAH